MWLNGECIMRRGNNVGGCVFGDMLENSPYIGFVVPFLFCSRVKLNQLSPLVSLIRLPLASTNNLPFIGNFFSD